jgi:hypothetical protein
MNYINDINPIHQGTRAHLYSPDYDDSHEYCGECDEALSDDEIYEEEELCGKCRYCEEHDYEV